MYDKRFVETFTSAPRDQVCTAHAVSPEPAVIVSPRSNETADGTLGILALDEVLRGLLSSPRHLPAKAFYDARGAALFEEITTLDEYYPTRTERKILDTHADAIATAIGTNAIVIEYGSGDASKSRVLLDQLRPSVYVPVDIAVEQLARVSDVLHVEYPDMTVRPVVADFTNAVNLPPDIARADARRVALFLGSTIGNFHPNEAVNFLQGVHNTIGANGALLLGADLRKDPVILHAAYNDSRGVTAAFNMNILERLHREHGATIDQSAFTHYAFYEPVRGRIEMHLVARRATTIDIAGHHLAFHAGESIWTESSYKFTVSSLEQLGAASGLRLSHVWMDTQEWFALALYTPEPNIS